MAAWQLLPSGRSAPKLPPSLHARRVVDANNLTISRIMTNVVVFLVGTTKAMRAKPKCESMAVSQSYVVKDIIIQCEKMK